MEPSEDNQAVFAVQHPLENQVILDLVMAYLQPLTFQERKHIRSVCKTWYFETLINWRATAFLNLKLGPTLNQNQPESPGVSMSEFLTLIENDHSGFSQFTDKPFQNYKLQNLVLDVFTVNNNNLFWTLVGPNIKRLSLEQVDIKASTHFMEKIMEFFVNQMPNLECFAVSSVYIDGNRVGQPPTSILRVHPNVKTLSISNCFAFGFANFPNLQEVTFHSCGSFDIAKLVKYNPHVMPRDIRDISHLRISSIQQIHFVNCTVDVWYPPLQFTALKKLSISSDIKIHGDFAIFSGFIRGHAYTLETIEAFGNFKKQVFFTGPDMICTQLSKLTELRAWGNIFSNFHFIRDTPNLKLLHLDLYGFEVQERIKKELSVRPPSDERWYETTLGLIDKTKIRVGQTPWPHLSYFQMNYELSKKSLQILAKWMPNVKTFKTVLNQVTFPFVCENWPELEHLECMFGSVILNENITGTSYGRGRRKMPLADMEDLTTFKLHTECNKSLLSDDCVANGFLRVPKLTDLSICVSPEFSQDAEILLRRGIRNVQLYRNYSSNPLHNNWQCCRDTEYKSFIFRPPIEPPRQTGLSLSQLIPRLPPHFPGYYNYNANVPGLGAPLPGALLPGAPVPGNLFFGNNAVIPGRPPYHFPPALPHQMYPPRHP